MQPPTDAVATIKGYEKPDRNFKPPHHENGWIDWKFSHLCRRYGYQEGRKIAERLCEDWADVIGSEGRELYRTYRAFIEAEKISSL